MCEQKASGDPKCAKWFSEQLMTSKLKLSELQKQLKEQLANVRDCLVVCDVCLPDKSCMLLTQVQEPKLCSMDIGEETNWSQNCS